jgi:hypothetical protein
MLMPSMKVVRLAFIGLAMLLSSAVHAARLEQPYVIDVPVASQGQADRLSAERAGLLLVLERLSGQRLDSNPVVKSALSKAENYLVQFSFLQEKPAVLPAGNPAGNPAPAWRMKMAFSSGPVNQLLGEAGVGIWPLERPEVMVLMANEQAALLPLPSADGTDAVAALVKSGQMRGVPLRVPDPASQDLTVAVAVQELDAAALLPQATQQKADALLLGNLRGGDDKGWSSQWVLHFKDKDQRFQQKAPTYPALMDAVLQQTALYLSDNYRLSATTDTVDNSGGTQLRLQVDNVRNFAAYNRLRQFIEKLDAVQHLGNTNISGTTVSMDIDIKGRESFRTLVELFKSLQWMEEVLPPPGSDPSLRPVWRYQWIE